MADSEPASHLGAALLAVVFCFPPTGVLALRNAVRVDERLGAGDPTGAARASERAHAYAVMSLVFGIFFYLVVFLVALAVGAA